MCEVPAFISEKAKIIISDLLPAKSKAQYEEEYASFCGWMQENGVTLVNEDVMLAYMDEKSKVLKPLVGVHSFEKMPAVIAEYLGLPNPELYTGHCFRRTAASLVADTGAELVTLKRLDGWHSSSVAETYIEDSVAKKKKVAALIMGEKESSELISSVANSVKVVASTSTSSNKSITSNLKNLTEKSFSFFENILNMPMLKYHFAERVPKIYETCQQQ